MGLLRGAFRAPICWRRTKRFRMSSSLAFFIIVAIPLPSIVPLVEAFVEEPPACSPGAYAPLPTPAPWPG